jgi:hypothetical protein
METSPTFSRLDPAERQVYLGPVETKPKGDAMDERHTAEYEAPRVVGYGDLVELTAEGSDGDCLDADFAAGTRKSSLTFSGC